VVRIDSPGGDGNASDLIWRELRRARKEKGKPVVASMGDVAASGGYYVAAGCDDIFAEPSTITGSIGVFFPKFDASELYEKLGVHMETVKRGASADLFGTNRPFTASEKATLQEWVDSFYEQFVERVAEARKLTREQVDAVARGRVWTGNQALERKLVDRLGGLQDALAFAGERAGLQAGDEVDVEDHGRAATLELSSIGAAALGSELPLALLGEVPRREATRALKALSLLGEPGTLRAVLPFVIEVH
jgi:protease-4